MKHKRQKTEVNLEFEEAVKLRTQRVVVFDCAGCGGPVRMIPANEAAMLSQRTEREIHRLVQVGKLHFMEDDRGLLYVCWESLQQAHEFQRRLLPQSECA